MSNPSGEMKLVFVCWHSPMWYYEEEFKGTSLEDARENAIEAGWKFPVQDSDDRGIRCPRCARTELKEENDAK